MLADAIDAPLPQTQCTRCGYPACRPYAEAIAAGEADINRCPPGGEAGIRTLAALLGVPTCRSIRRAASSSRCRSPSSTRRTASAARSASRRARSTRSLGAPRRMHTVIAELCTGCDLCVAALPGGLHRDAVLARRCASALVPSARAGGRCGRANAARTGRTRRGRATSRARLAWHARPASARIGWRDERRRCATRRRPQTKQAAVDAARRARTCPASGVLAAASSR